MNLARRLSTLSLLALALAAPPAHASSVVKMEVADMATRADVIVHGTIRSQTTVRRGELVVTEITLDVHECLKGDLGETFTYARYGGVLDGRGSAIAGEPTFLDDEEVLLFLDAENEHGFRLTIGLAQGKYRLRGVAGSRQAYRNLEGLRLVDPDTGDERRGEIQAAVSYRSVRDEILAALDPEDDGE